MKLSLTDVIGHLLHSSSSWRYAPPPHSGCSQFNLYFEPPQSVHLCGRSPSLMSKQADLGDGTDATRKVAENAFELLEDYSCFRQKEWTSIRRDAVLEILRSQAYGMVGNSDATRSCAHCAGVMLYCQFRGFGCQQVDFVTDGWDNPFYARAVEASGKRSKIANIVIGLVCWNKKEWLRSLGHFEWAGATIPIALFLQGQLRHLMGEYGKALVVLKKAAKRDHCLANFSVGVMAKMGRGCKSDDNMAAQYIERARVLGTIGLRNSISKG